MVLEKQNGYFDSERDDERMVKHVLGICDTDFGICCIVGFVHINVLNLEEY